MERIPSRQGTSPHDLTIVLVISLGSFMAGLDATIVNIALPAIAKSFNVSTVTVSRVLNAYLIVMVSFLLAASRLGDMKGCRGIFLTGFCLFTLGSRKKRISCRESDWADGMCSPIQFHLG